MVIVITALFSLHNRVLELLKKHIAERGLDTKHMGAAAIWEITYQKKPLFRELIGDFNPLYLHYKTNFKKDRRFNIGGRTVVKFEKTEYLSAFLKYLGYNDGTLADRLVSFLNTDLDDEDINFQVGLLEQNVNQRQKAHQTVSEFEKAIEKSAERLSHSFVPYLVGERFWFYFYGYSKHKIQTNIESDWPLVKLLLHFKEKSGIDLQTEISNTGDPDFHDYAGKTDFLTSTQGVLVINCRTYPHCERQLNIKMNIGSGRGDIFLGQYLNYESEGRIISGSVLMQRIPRDFIKPVPKVHRIPKLTQGITMYTEDFEGVDKNILQYLHDKRTNSRRTSIRFGYCIPRLEKWLKSHYLNQSANDM